MVVSVTARPMNWTQPFSRRRLSSLINNVLHEKGFGHTSSLAWPDPFRAGTYWLEIISAVLQGSGIVNRHKINNCHLRLVSVNYTHHSFSTEWLKLCNTSWTRIGYDIASVRILSSTHSHIRNWRLYDRVISIMCL